MKLVYTVLVLAALVYAERRLIEPRLTGARLSALVQAALVYTVLVYQEWIRFVLAFFSDVKNSPSFSNSMGCTSDQQFAFKANQSTTLCTGILMETATVQLFSRRF